MLISDMCSITSKCLGNLVAFGVANASPSYYNEGWCRVRDGETDHVKEELAAQVPAHSAVCNHDQHICALQPCPGTFLLELHDSPEGSRTGWSCEGYKEGAVLCMCVGRFSDDSVISGAPRS